ncbi:E3 ubiquitin-protein ligase RNF13 isoform X2 [Ochlerotatus camptorhynchus]|uniref:E3 ubiquitin-protein ligase RNF13 isoform X2 n=1 Tax=Ochlerotatus camptorhynchus TaxID=644619 RepID=UPI0031DE07A5
MALSMMVAFVARSLLTNYHLVLLLSVFLLTKSARGDILVYQQDQLLEEFRDFPAKFGSDIPESGIKVRAVRAVPLDGCSEMVGPPENVTSMGAPGVSARFAVIIARYNCSFEDKVRNAQKAGYVAVIVHNVGSNDLERMSANHAEDIIIPSVFIGESNGMYIIESFLYPLTYELIITDDIPFNINNNLIIPFAIVVGLCFIIMVCFMVIRCIRERRRMLRHRLPNSVLRKIPIVKFAKGMQYDTCAICLDDYVDNERLRVLPCHHAYHVKCIDPWLTKNRRVCPICKRKVFARGERRPPRRRSSTDSMSSSDADEHTPLLNSVETQPNGASSTSSPPTNYQSQEGAAVTPGGPNEAHVVNMTTDDEEMLDAEAQARALHIFRQMAGAPQRRFNPFERVVQSQPGQPGVAGAAVIEEGGESPYSPIGEDQSSTSAWSRFVSKMRFYVRNQPRQEEILSDDDDVEPATGETRPIATGSRNAFNTASNNILNGNLSGSFHGDDTTDDEMVGASFRDEAKRRQIRSAPNLPSTSGVASGSAGSGGRLGVAALPNVNFNPINQLSRTTGGDPGRRQNRSAGGGGGGGGSTSGGQYPV